MSPKALAQIFSYLGAVLALLALHVDVLLTPGTPITLAAQRATSTVPIVCVVGDPVRTIEIQTAADKVYTM